MWPRSIEITCVQNKFFVEILNTTPRVIIFIRVLYLELLEILYQLKCRPFVC